MPALSRSLRFSAVFVLAVLLAGCTATRLEPQRFEGRTIAAAAPYAPAPFVDHPLLAPRTRPARPPLLRGEQDNLEDLQERLRAAAKRVDVPARLAAALFHTAADELGARRTADARTADYVLDFRVHHYGLRLRSYRSQARFFMEAEARLIERATGEAIWAKRLRSSRTFATGRTGADLGRLADAAFADLLADLSSRAAERMQAALQNDVAP
ncbi:MAG: hypothetical protein R3247_05795 [Rhodothermales bacterium]|nr:hypothetical protein [Rhodothermales bacterium]